MAARKPSGMNGGGRGGGSGGGKKLSITAIFWMLFIVIIISLFIINLSSIKNVLAKTRFFDRVFNRPVESTAPAEDLPRQPPLPPAGNPAGNPAVPESGGFPQTPLAPSGEMLPFDPSFPFGTDNPADLQNFPPAAGQQNNPAAGQQGNRPAGQRGNPPTAPQNSPAAPQNSPPTARLPVSPAMRERTLYFVTVDNSGMVFLSPAKRNLPNTASPLAEAVTSLLAGPDNGEKTAGLTTLIPPGVKLVSARIQGNTAFLNFNESFLFNTYDAEGYYAQLRQIVWTATEFPNIRNVQFLIENRKVKYLGLTIRIDEPLGRESL